MPGMASYFIDFCVVLDSDHMTLRWPSQRFVNSEPSYRNSKPPLRLSQKVLCSTKHATYRLASIHFEPCRVISNLSAPWLFVSFECIWHFLGYDQTSLNAKSKLSIHILLYSFVVFVLFKRFWIVLKKMRLSLWCLSWVFGSVCLHSVLCFWVAQIE